MSPKTSHFLTLEQVLCASLHPPLFWQIPTTYSNLPKTIWRLMRHQPQESPQMSCPMIRTVVTSVCQLRDIVSHRNLIIALEWRKGERERSSIGFEPHRKLPCSAVLRLSVRSGKDQDPQENKIDPVRCTGTHILRKSSLAPSCNTSLCADQTKIPSLKLSSGLR